MPNMNVDLKPALTASFSSHAVHLLCSLDPAFVHISKMRISLWWWRLDDPTWLLRFEGVNNEFILWVILFKETSFMLLTLGLFSMWLKYSETC